MLYKVTKYTYGNFYDAYGNLYDAYGNLYDAYGNLYDAYGNLYDAYGNLYDAYGNLYDAYGNVIKIAMHVINPVTNTCLSSYKINKYFVVIKKPIWVKSIDPVGRKKGGGAHTLCEKIRNNFDVE
jgi:tetratricopeptide (TPR) repeat protein